MKELEISIKGMHCKSCEILISDKLEELPEVQRAVVRLKTKTATIYAHEMPAPEAIVAAVESAGYEIGEERKPWLSRNKKDYKDAAIGVAWVRIWFSSSNVLRDPSDFCIANDCVKISTQYSSCSIIL